MTRSILFRTLRVMQKLTAAALVWAMAHGTAQAQSITLEGIAFEESRYLPSEELHAIASGYINRPVTFEDLLRLVEEINALYIQSGIPTASAALPPQEIRDGVLRVSLVEASINRVVIEGNDTTSEAFLRQNLSLTEGELPDFDQLERDLIIFDLAHDIRPQLSFGAGSETATAEATVTITEPKRFETVLSLDNFGRVETGEMRGSALFRWNSVTGVRDSLSLQALGSEGAQSVSVGYSRPVGPGGGRLITALGQSRSEIIGGPFAAIDIESDSRFASIVYRRPVRVRADSHVMLDVGVDHEQTESSTVGLPFADISVTDLVLSAAYSRRLDAASQLSFSLGLRAGSSDARGTSETEGQFWLLHGKGQYSRLLGEEWVFDGALRYQIAPDQNLPVARLFSAGGVGSVRGYPNDIRSGDSGAVVTLQVSRRTPWDWGQNVSARPFAFIDAAAVMPFRVNGGFDSDQDFLASAGAGLTVSIAERVSALAGVAVPLKDTLGFSGKGEPKFFLSTDVRF